jgi:transposase-like protein
MARTSREEWAKRVERWKDSGLTAAEFATEVGINAHSLTWWKWRLASEAAGRGPARRSPTRKPRISAAPSPLTFLEMTSPVRSEALEVVLPTSIRIRVPPDFDAAALGRLLGVLEQHR